VFARAYATNLVKPHDSSVYFTAWSVKFQQVSHPIPFPPSYSYMMIKGNPCKVLSISVSKTGKHGHAKCNFLATDIFTGKKYEDMIPSTHGTTVPLVKKTEWELIDIEGDELTLMDEGGTQKTDLNLPSYPDGLAEEIREAWNGGENSVIVTVQSAVGVEQIVGYKKENTKE
jgi:translation initiation factor 5A